MWQGIEGHDAVVARFRRALERRRLASTFLFVGPPGVGKRSFALALAKSLLCERRDEALLDPCGICPSCVQVEAGTHPDLYVLGLPEGKSSIPIKLLIGEDETRMREGLCYDISLKPFMGNRKVAILDDADYFNTPAVANCLLKTLEEPPPRSVIILIGTSATKQLPTIRSRAQLVRFEPLSQETVARLLVEKQLVADAAEANRLAAFSEGSLSRAIELSDPELWRFRGELLAKLAGEPIENFRLAPSVVAFVDAAGKEAPPRRARARLLIGFAISFYRRLLYRQVADDAPRTGDRFAGDDDAERHVSAALKRGQKDPEATAARIERSLEALSHIDRNANQATLLEAWLDDLRLARSGALVEV
ncbi:MAG: DNA polymerase III subunit delta' [Pirellulales bacterium]